MNLKESFRYQNFLDTLIADARCSIMNLSHSMIVTKNHLRSKANPDAVDEVMVEIVEDFYPNDKVVKFLVWAVNEKEVLARLISNAKTSADFDLDSSVSSNRQRKELIKSINWLLAKKESKTKEYGTDYKFNVEGDQISYRYEIEVERKENFNRAELKATVKQLNSVCDEVSSKIDEFLINTTLDYTPKFDVNSSFDDVMESFISEDAADTDWETK